MRNSIETGTAEREGALPAGRGTTLGSRVRKTALTLTAVTIGVGIPAVVAQPAFADDGPVTSVYYSPNGGGAKATADIDFASSYKVYFKNIYLNDFCPGDDKRAQLKFKIRYEGDSGWTTVGDTRTDVGGCTSAPYTESLASWSSSRRINDATVVACVQDRGCANPNDSYHDNPYWGAS